MKLLARLLRLFEREGYDESFRVLGFELWRRPRRFERRRDEDDGDREDSSREGEADDEHP